MKYVEFQEAEGIHADKYEVGDMETDGHTHIFYLRDDLPVATSTESAFGNDVGMHAHAIVAGPEKSLVCEPVNTPSHTHSKIVKVESD